MQNAIRGMRKVRWPAEGGAFEEATHTAPEPAEPHGRQEMRRT